MLAHENSQQEKELSSLRGGPRKSGSTPGGKDKDPFSGFDDDECF